MYILPHFKITIHRTQVIKYKVPATYEILTIKYKYHNVPIFIYRSIVSIVYIVFTIDLYIGTYLAIVLPILIVKYLSIASIGIFKY